MEDEKPTPKKFIRNCDTPLIDELGDLSPLKEMKGPKVPSNRQVLRFFSFFAQCRQGIVTGYRNRCRKSFGKTRNCHSKISASTGRGCFRST